MLSIGITGGIGSGKTTVCRILENLGVPVYYADARSKYMLANDPEVRAALIAAFGQEIISQEGELDRAALARIVFSDPVRLKELEGIAHPAVARDFKLWKDQQKTPYVVKEAALLFEAGSYRELDQTCLVSAPLEVRIQRVMERDRLSREEILQRIARQMPEDKKQELAGALIMNDGFHALLPQVLRLHEFWSSGLLAPRD